MFFSTKSLSKSDNTVIITNKGKYLEVTDQGRENKLTKVILNVSFIFANMHLKYILIQIPTFNF